MYSPEEIRQTTFEKTVRGYRTEDVEYFLSKIADNIEQVTQEKDKVEKQIFVLAEKIEQYNAEEENIKNTLMSAQRLAETIIKDAKTKAEGIIKEANIKKNDILSQAHDEHDYYETNLIRLKKDVSDFRENILNIYRNHIELISTLPKSVVTENTVADTVVEDVVVVDEPIVEPVIDTVFASDKTDDEIADKFKNISSIF